MRQYCTRKHWLGFKLALLPNCYHTVKLPLFGSIGASTAAGYQIPLLFLGLQLGGQLLVRISHVHGFAHLTGSWKGYQ